MDEVKELQTVGVRESGQEMSMQRNPDAVLGEAKRAAIALKDVISKKSKPVIFNGEQYLELEDWETVGAFFGASVRTGDAIPVEIEGGKGAKAKAFIINRDGIEIGGAEAYCMRDEPVWAKKPWFQLASMAQTRAAAKAYRNKFSWVVVLSGYKPTPAEEMEGVFHKPADTPKPPKSDKAESPKANGNVVRFVPTEIKVKSGTNKNNKPYTKYGIVDGEGHTYGTFDSDLGKMAEKAKADNQEIEITYEVSGEFLNLTGAKLVQLV